MSGRRCFLAYLRILAAILCVWCLSLSGRPNTALAFEPGTAAEETGKTELSLTVFFGTEQEGFPDVEFRLYRVGEMDLSRAEFALTGAFEQYSVPQNAEDSSEWKALAETLHAYVVRDEITPDEKSRTDEVGKAYFNGLEKGLYLVEGDPYREGSLEAEGVYLYTPEPFLISVPGLDGNNWIDEVTAACKFESGYTPPNVDRSVQKVWKDDGHEDSRPKEIEVQLLRDGEVEDAVILNAENGWSHTWTGLAGDARWQLAESEVPEGYTVLVHQEGILFVVTNSYSEEEPEEPGTSERPESPDDSKGPGRGETTERFEKDETPLEKAVTEVPASATTEAQETQGQPSLPQTGVLQWPVPVFAGIGLCLFLIGWKRRRS